MTVSRLTVLRPWKDLAMGLMCFSRLTQVVTGWVAQRTVGVVRVRRHARLIQGAGLFDRAHYLAQCADDSRARRHPIRHYLRLGAAAGLDPNPFFDTRYYLEHNPDVAARGRNPLVHYIRYGAAQGRATSPRFDTRAYVECNPGVASLGVEALAHYLRRGRDEGRVAVREQNPLRVVGLAMVKNEEDLIEPFVRHNLRYLDVLFVADNGSTDRTREILVALEREGLPLIVVDDPVVAYFQSEKMTRMLRCVSAAILPDYIVPLDADEFIRCSAPSVFRARLAQIPPGAAGAWRWCTYVVTPQDVPRDLSDVPRVLASRRKVEDPSYAKVIVRLDRRHALRVELAQGNHSASEGGVPLPQTPLDDLSLGHFPVRGERQLSSKAVLHWIANVARDPLARSGPYSYQAREVFDLVVKNGSISRKELPERSMGYAQPARAIDWTSDVVIDPMQFTYERRYPVRSDRSSALGDVARSWERTLTPPEAPSSALRMDIEERLADVQGSVLRGSSPATAFDAEWHLRGPRVDVAPYRYLAERFQPGSVLDVGCGQGAALRLFQSFGTARVLGIDGVPAQATLLGDQEYLQRDLTVPFRLGREFDLVLCVEVVEHLPPGGDEALLASVAAHARDLVLFSAAEPGQPGEGHINCRPLGEWLSRWAELGWEPELLGSLAFRAISTFSWLRRNPVLLRRRLGGPTDAQAVSRLLEIAARPYHWYSQEPAIHDHAFQEEPPSDIY